MVSNMAIIVYTVTEKPWKEAEINYLAIANEVFLYMLLVLLLGGKNHEGSMNEDVLGWLIIAIVTICIVVNLVVMLVKAYYHIKLLFTRHSNKKAYLLRKQKVAPLPDLESEHKKGEEESKNESVVLQVIEEESSIKEQESAIVNKLRHSQFLAPPLDKHDKSSKSIPMVTV